MKKVAVTIFPSRTSFSFWSNGAHQNVCYLAKCLQVAGFDVVLLNGGDGSPPTVDSLPPELRSIPWRDISDEALDDVDLLIQAGAQVSAEHVERVRARGGRAVNYKFGADLIIDAERTIHGKNTGAILNGSKFDEVWTTTQHHDTCGSYWQIVYRAPVRVLPHIWASCFVDQMTAAFPLLEATCSDGSIERHTFPTPGYRPGRAKKRIAILEPNINLIKTSHVPILIAEQAFRRHPQKIDRVLVACSEHLKTHAGFATFVGALDLQKTLADDGHPVISFEGRRNTAWFLSANADVVISHQMPGFTWANYSHYDALYLGYPIVHNVPEMRKAGVGYFYEGFNAIEGADALRTCLETYDSYYDQKRAAANAFLATRLATSPANVETHRAAVESVFEGWV